MDISRGVRKVISLLLLHALPVPAALLRYVPRGLQIVVCPLRLKKNKNPVNDQT